MSRLVKLWIVLALLIATIVSLSSAAPIDDRSGSPQGRSGPQSSADQWTRDDVKKLARQLQDEANQAWDECMNRYSPNGWHKPRYDHNTSGYICCTCLHYTILHPGNRPFRHIQCNQILTETDQKRTIEEIEATTDTTSATMAKNQQLIYTIKIICSREVYRRKEKTPERQWMNDWEDRRQQQRQAQPPPGTNNQGGGDTNPSYNGRGNGNGRNNNDDALDFGGFFNQMLDSFERYGVGVGTDRAQGARGPGRGKGRGVVPISIPRRLGPL